MPWSGFIALGTIADGSFTEVVSSAYARQQFEFGDARFGHASGVGPAVVWDLITDGKPWTFNGYGFFTMKTGGSPVLIYPGQGDSAQPGLSYSVMPAQFGILVATSSTDGGAAVPETFLSEAFGLTAAVPD